MGAVACMILRGGPTPLPQDPVALMTAHINCGHRAWPRRPHTAAVRRGDCVRVERVAGVHISLGHAHAPYLLLHGPHLLNVVLQGRGGGGAHRPAAHGCWEQGRAAAMPAPQPRCKRRATEEMQARKGSVLGDAKGCCGVD